VIRRNGRARRFDSGELKLKFAANNPTFRTTAKRSLFVLAEMAPSMRRALRGSRDARPAITSRGRHLSLASRQLCHARMTQVCRPLLSISMFTDCVLSNSLIDVQQITTYSVSRPARGVRTRPDPTPCCRVRDIFNSDSGYDTRSCCRGFNSTAARRIDVWSPQPFTVCRVRCRLILSEWRPKSIKLRFLASPVTLRLTRTAPISVSKSDRFPVLLFDRFER
jgi:hypothetical protein